MKFGRIQKIESFVEGVHMPVASLRLLGPIAIAAVLGACARAPEPVPAEQGLVVPGGAGLLFQVSGQRSNDDLTALAGLVRERLAAFGVDRVQIETIAPNRLRALVQGAKADRATRVEQLIARPVSMSITPVDPGLAFFAGLVGKLPKAGGVRVAEDRLGNLRYGKLVRIAYLVADDGQTLARFIRGLAPPKGQRLAVMNGAGGALAFLVNDPAPIENPVVTQVRVIAPDEGGSVAVGAELAKPFRTAFDDLVRASLHRPLAFVVDGQVVALPVVAGRARRGEIRIEPSPLAADEHLRPQAEQLAVKLKSWQLVGDFKLLKKVVTP